MNGWRDLRVGRGGVEGGGEGWRGWTGRNGSLKKRSEGWGDGLGTEVGGLEARC